jgi:hypothetical protein
LFFSVAVTFSLEGTIMALASAAVFGAKSPRLLAALDRTGLEDLFRVWPGASGRRYICSVYPIGEPPVFDCRRAIVAAVRKSAAGAGILSVFVPGAEDEADELRARSEKAHLLADTAEARDFVARDLAPPGASLSA